MFSTRTFLEFCFQFVLIYGVFALPWPGVVDGYGVYYRFIGNQLWGTESETLVVRFIPTTLEEKERQDEYLDTDIVLADPRNRLLDNPNKAVAERVHITSRYYGYMETAFILSLILATPISERRKKGKALF